MSDRRRLYGQDREVIAIWREHGIPLDRTTVDHAATIIVALADELATAWDVIGELLDGRPVVCGACATEVQPPLPLEVAP